MEPHVFHAQLPLKRGSILEYAFIDRHNAYALGAVWGFFFGYINTGIDILNFDA
jgi:hypothetical protein